MPTEERPIQFDARRQARSLYWRGWGVTEIAEELGLNSNTVAAWKRRDAWDTTGPVERIAEALDMRLQVLIAKEKKSGGDCKEIDLLGRQIERIARVRRFSAPDGHEGDLNEKVGNRNAGPKKPHVKNLIDREAVQKLVAALERGMFAFQQTWWESTTERIRMLLKSRQVGATYHFARERLLRALLTGNNQIFISASKNQANIFRQYIVEFVRAETGVKLTGDPIEIDRGDAEDGSRLEPVQLLFLGTNYRTAQGYHGDVVIDEYAWIYGFEQLYKVASAMATQKRYTVTLFSTPSTIHHESYPMWSGERFNRRRAKVDRVRIGIGHDELKFGQVGADRIWRQIVTLQDAIDAGYDLIDIDELKFEYSLDEFNNLFNCEFIDDSASTFPMSLVQPCMVDSFFSWKDVQPMQLRPYAGDVWLGYDPNESETGDNAALVAVAAPKGKKDKFRVIEKIQLRGLDFEGQAALIKKWCGKYNVTNIGIDTTGVGAAVFQLVVKFFPLARALRYDPALKTQMVHKAKNVFSNRRIEFDSGWTDLARALMSIHAQLTKGQRQITYVARRSAETGHGDLAWALLHALYFEPLDAGETGQTSTVEIYDGQSDGGRFSNDGDGGYRSAGNYNGVLQLRGCGIRFGGPADRLRRVLVEWQVVRDAGQPAPAGAVEGRVAASSVRDRRQAQPVGQDVPALKVA